MSLSGESALETFSELSNRIAAEGVERLLEAARNGDMATFSLAGERELAEAGLPVDDVKAISVGLLHRSGPLAAGSWIAGVLTGVAWVRQPRRPAATERCSCGAPEPCTAPRFGGEHVRPETWGGPPL